MKMGFDQSLHGNFKNSFLLSPKLSLGSHSFKLIVFPLVLQANS